MTVGIRRETEADRDAVASRDERRDPLVLVRRPAYALE